MISNTLAHPILSYSVFHVVGIERHGLPSEKTCQSLLIFVRNTIALYMSHEHEFTSQLTVTIIDPCAWLSLLPNNHDHRSKHSFDKRSTAQCDWPLTILCCLRRLRAVGYPVMLRCCTNSQPRSYLSLADTSSDHLVRHVAIWAS